MAHLNLKAARRRLLRKRREEGTRRLFAVGDVVQGLESVVALVVVPRGALSTPDRMAEIATAIDGATAALSGARVKLFSARDDASPITIGAASGHHVFVRKATLPDGHALFYVTVEPEAAGAQPYALLMNKRVYERVQKVAAELIGAKLVLPETAR